ncbi:hypothetical protein K525DRAFT_255391 [Schizophyllum commune Loenen D]|nr:hypothetical protein K525DRAFT_255391 [Schizophyllum commune Loenen D]
MQYLLDDQSADIAYLCPVTHQTVLGSYFNNTWTSISDESCGDGWFQLTFSGVGVTVSAPSSSDSPEYSATIDGAAAQASLTDAGFEFKDLDDGEHTLVFSSSATSVHPALDYIAVLAGQSTALEGRSIVTDDADAALSYTGEWSSEPPFNLVLGRSTGPYAGTTHWSNTVGDALSFSFTGDSVAVYGTLPPSAGDGAENVTVSYAIDDEAPTSSPLPPALVPNQAAPKTLLFHVDGLSAGAHTLTLNVTGVVDAGSPLGIDFILYNATFDKVDDENSAAGKLSQSGAADKDKGVNIGAIVGGVLGALASLSAIGLLIFVLVRRRNPRRAQDMHDWKKIISLPVAGSKTTIDMKF